MGNTDAAEGRFVDIDLNSLEYTLDALGANGTELDVHCIGGPAPEIPDEHRVANII
jgi:hypothetical protein